jgi:hypothetical protein
MSIDNLKSLHHWINVEPHGDGSPLCAGCNTQGSTDQGHHDDAGVPPKSIPHPAQLGRSHPSTRPGAPVAALNKISCNGSKQQSSFD